MKIEIKIFEKNINFVIRILLVKAKLSIKIFFSQRSII